MNVVLKDSFVFFTYALLAFFAQNAIFTRGLGISRLVQLVGDDETSSNAFCAVLCTIQVLTAPLAYFVNLWLLPYKNRVLVRPLAYFFVILVVCVLLFLCWQRLKRIFPVVERFLQVLPIAAFNSCVMGTLLVTTKQDYSLLQTIGFGFGSGIGYILAVMLITEAQRKLRSPSIPQAFKGLPITLLYIGVLALAIYGFTGHTVVI